ncbi:MAG: RIP metalloprotease RseP [Bacilli bacterium]
MDSIIGIIAFLFVLGIIIVIHEAGHFLFARKFGILSREFAFGMGPLLYKKKKGETLYSIRAFPIGGFCAIAGEEVENDPLKEIKNIRVDIVDGVITKIYIDPKSAEFKNKPEFILGEYDIFDQQETGNLYMFLNDGHEEIKYPVDPQAMFVFEKQEFQIAPYNRTINSKKKRQRAMVIIGGPMMNFLLALIVFLLAGLIGGFPDQSSSKLNVVDEGTPAYVAGFQKNDEILSMSIDDITLEINKWEDISLFMDQYYSAESDVIVVSYKRGNDVLETNITPQVVIYSSGITSDFTKAGVIVGSVDGKSKVAGLKPGDEITKINSIEVSSWKEVYSIFMQNTTGSKVIMEVNRGEATNTVEFNPYSSEVMDSQKSLSGDNVPLARFIMSISPTNEFNLIKSLEYSVVQTVSSGGLVFSTLKLLFTSNEVGVDDLSSFVGIYELSKNVAVNIGFIGILNLIGLLSVNVGLLNLLPIPALDGGRLVFIGYEAITKKRPNQKVETALITVTMFLLFGLMIFAFYNDILRLIGVK